MNKLTVYISVAILLLISFAGTNLMAQVTPGSFSLSPHIGWYVFDSDQDISNAPVHGIGFGYNYNKNLGVEARFDYVNSDVKPADDDADLYIYRLDGLYHFMADKEYVPYIAAGIGAITVDQDNNGSETNTLFNYGAGLKAFITESLAIRGDVRHIIDVDDSNNNFAYTLGVTYSFGKKGKPVPPPAAPKDSDGDGVIDEIDRCPDTPLGVVVDKFGCPVDSDGDGVPDFLDKCPDTPLGVPVDSDGCPLDSDGDGVYDYIDECPDTPPGLLVDEKGCPVMSKEKVSIELQIEFEFDKAEIKNVYQDHLRKISDFLKANPETKAVIEGHTCSIGTEQYNLKLSQKRADSVIRRLIDEGVESTRLEAKAYGESMPIADNKTAAGRRKNRRVTADISTIVINVIKKQPGQQK
jgi:OOP family OmpA-OmpF porin